MNADPETLPFLKVPNSIYLERFDKFLSAYSYNDVNLFSKLYSDPAPLENVHLAVYSVPDTKRITFKQAMVGSYRPTQKEELFGPSWSTHWFKIQGTIPISWRSETVVFVFRVDNAEGLIYDTQGHPIHGLSGGDWNDNNRRTDYILTQQAKGGESFQFYIEVACNGLFGNGENNLIAPPSETRFFRLLEADLRIFRQDVFTLYLDFQIIKDMARELIPTSNPRGHQALMVANEIMDTFYTTQSIQACLKLADAFLNEKDPSPIHTIASIGHCHIDTAWLWPYDETRRKVTRSWATQRIVMDRFPGYKFACSQAQQYAWLLEDHPDLFRRIQEKAKEKKFLPVGGTWVEFDGNIPSGESFVRHFLYGQLFFSKHFGKVCDVFWLPDTFGYSAQLPQIGHQAGIQYFFTQKLSWNNINKFPHTTFYWASLDHTKILTHFAPADTYCGQITVKEMLMHLTNNKDLSVPISLDVFGNGDGGGGPTLAMVAKQARLANVKGLPQVTPMDPTDFFNYVEKTSGDKLTHWQGELYFELHRGTYTSQAETKKFNRQCEALLHDLEIVYTILHSSSYPYSEIEQLWKLVLLNQFHDVLPGSSIGLVYKDARKIYNDVVQRGSRLLEKGLALFPQNESSPSTWSAFNTCGFKRQFLLQIPASSNLAFAQMNSKGTHGYVTIEAMPLCWSPVNVVRPSIPVTVKQFTDRILLENEFIQYVFNVRGELMFIFDKRNQFSVSCPNRPGNVFELYSDVPLYWDAWDVEVYHLRTRHLPSSSSFPSKLSILSSGPLRAELYLELSLTSTSWLRQWIQLDTLSPLLTFETQVSWNEAHRLLKVAFPLDLVAEMATYETAFGKVTRPTHRNTSWDLARFEVCGHRFADLSETQYGVSLINDSKYGYSCLGNVLRLSLLRSPKSPDRECDVGEHHFRYALLPHLGPCGIETVHEAISFNQPLHLIPDAIPTSSTIHLNPPDAVILDTLKLAEDQSGDWIVRLYECLGASSMVQFELPKAKLSNVWLVDLLERAKDKLTLNESKNGFQFGFRPYQIKTFRIKFL